MTDYYNEKGLTILDIWCRELRGVYDRFGIEKEKVDKIIEKCREKAKKPVCNTRNTYEFKSGIVELDNIIDYIITTDGIIDGVGSIVRGHSVQLSFFYNLIIDLKKRRGEMKKLAIQYESADDTEKARLFDALQGVMKEYLNALYGAMGLFGGYLFNRDAVAAIPGQGRQIISELMWSIEKFLAKNMVFDNFNEYVMYSIRTIEQKFDKELLSYIDHYPTHDDLWKHTDEMMETMDKYNTHYVSNKKYIDIFIRSFNDDEKLLYYYNNNFRTFVDKNPKIKQLFRNIMDSDIEFTNPYKTPEGLQHDMDLISRLFKNFVVNRVVTQNRIKKYKTKKRKSVVISDTDSIMPSLDFQIKYFSEAFDDIDFDTDKNIFKIVNVVTILCNIVTDVHCDLLAESANISKDYFGILSMKNEIFFQRVMINKGQKKNYIGRRRLREGAIIPPNAQRVIVGGLRNSGVNVMVGEQFNTIIDNDILFPKEINPNNVLRGIDNIENEIKVQVLHHKNKTFGMAMKFGGVTRYADLEKTYIARAAMVWNRIYPDNPITAGDAFFAITTKVHTVDDAKRLIKDKQILNIVLDVIFDIDNKHDYKSIKQDYSKYGLAYIGVPRIGYPKNIPDWLVDIIDMDSIINHHLSKPTRILPNINIPRTKINSTTIIKSHLISL